MNPARLLRRAVKHDMDKAEEAEGGGGHQHDDGDGDRGATTI